MSSDNAALEARALAAEEKLAVLMARVQRLEMANGPPKPIIQADDAEVQKVKAENAKLKEQLARRDYRISHLVSALNRELAQRARLDYRIAHLTNSVQMLLGESPASLPPVPTARPEQAVSVRDVAPVVQPAAQPAKPSEAKQQPTAKPKKAKKAKAPAPAPADDGADPVLKLDLRVGRIRKVWLHPDSEKLFCEEVDVGDGKVLQVASGLRAHYSLAEMDQRRILVLVNLKPKKMAGFASQAMVLCAKSEDGKVEFVDPPADAPVGAQLLVEGLGAPTPTGRINLGSSKSAWAQVAPRFRVDADRTLRYGDNRILVGGYPCTAPSIAAAPVS